MARSGVTALEITPRPWRKIFIGKGWTAWPSTNPTPPYRAPRSGKESGASDGPNLAEPEPRVPTDFTPACQPPPAKRRAGAGRDFHRWEPEQTEKNGKPTRSIAVGGG